jgi:hypothetical protein
MKKSLSGMLVFALIGLALAWAISSEPVYIKGFKNIQDFKAQLGKMTSLMSSNPSLLGAQNPLASLIDGESGKLDAVRSGDETTRVEVTKIYRQLDASRTTLLGKGLSPNQALVSQIAETIKSIEKLNNIRG